MSPLQPAVGPDGRLHPVLAARVDSGPVLVCCDYDGTLSPIVDDPDQAEIDDDMRRRLTRLTECAQVAIVSGRALDDVTHRVAVGDVIYAGSHGFEIANADGTRYRHAPAETSTPALDRSARELEQRLDTSSGVRIERKPFAIAVHTRTAKSDEVRSRAHRVVHDIGDAEPDLRARDGKEIIELEPDVDWDKGRAVERIVSMLDLANGTVLYLGDDTTDEDAFTLLQHDAFVQRDTLGIGIVVGHRCDTAADYGLEDPAAVGLFLTRLADRLGGSTNGDPGGW